eukprot:gene22157-26867_t
MGNGNGNADSYTCDDDAFAEAERNPKLVLDEEQGIYVFRQGDERKAAPNAAKEHAAVAAPHRSVGTVATKVLAQLLI